MIHTNRCKYCGETKVEHEFGSMFCPGTTIKFRDSGLAALDAHKEELWEAVNQFTIGVCTFGKAAIGNAESFQKLASILNQIEKEK